MQDIRLKVECYSGYKLHERPLNFTLGERRFVIEEILDHWYGPDYDYFKVKADDKNIYILKYSGQQDQWSLQFFKAEGDPTS